MEGKTAIVTGAGRGLGLAMTHGLVRSGARVAMVELDSDVLHEAAADFGDAVVPIAGDVSNPDDTARMLEETQAAFGGLDIVVNNAGLGPQRFRNTDRTDLKRVWEIDLSDWQLYMDANATGHFMMAKTMLPLLLEKGWGRIINVTTSLETMINYGNGAYGPSKAAAEALATMIAVGLEGSGVTCNVLIPGGPADTRMISPSGVYADRSKLIHPDVMVAPLLYLASEESGAVNNRRVRAALWDPDRSPQDNLDKASAPIAWPQLGGQAIHPEGDPRGNPLARKELDS